MPDPGPNPVEILASRQLAGGKDAFWTDEFKVADDAKGGLRIAPKIDATQKADVAQRMHIDLYAWDDKRGDWIMAGGMGWRGGVVAGKGAEPPPDPTLTVNVGDLIGRRLRLRLETEKIVSLSIQREETLGIKVGSGLEHHSVAWVQNKVVDATFADHVHCPSLTVTAGGSLTVAYSHNRGSGTVEEPVTSDDKTNVWLNNSNGGKWVVHPSIGNFGVGIAVAAAAATGATVVTVTASVEGWLRVGLTEWSGMNAAPADGTSSAYGNSANPAAGSITPSANGVEVAILGTYTNETLTPGTGWTEIYEAEALMPCSAAYQLTTGGTAYNAGWTVASDWWWACAVALKEAAAAGGSAYERMCAESMGYTDAPVRVASFARSSAEAVGMTDAAVRVAAFARAAAENMGVTDALVKAADYARMSAETVTLSDALVHVADYTRVAAEAEGMTDAAGQAAAYVRATAEALGFTDAADRIVAFVRMLAESENMTDHADRIAAFVRTLGEAEGMTDAQRAQLNPLVSALNAAVIFLILEQRNR
jgi:hypothetical protein